MIQACIKQGLPEPKFEEYQGFRVIFRKPFAKEELTKLGLNERQLKAVEYQRVFDQIHESNWDIKTALSARFIFEKQQRKFQEITTKDTHDLIYFDAFGPRVQPELWTEAIFKKMYDALKKGGVLVTYSAKGSVRRAMISVGFTVEKIPGPPGKREMLRAVK